MQGSVQFALVRSPCENILHSLVNTRQYNGVFLPGFCESHVQPGLTARPLSLDLTGLTHLDHLTYVCRPGQSKDILDWYRHTCGMETFIINPSQGSDVFEVEGEAGLRLMVGEWLSEWLCREVGGEIQDGQHKTNFKLVLAEPLGEDGHVSRRVKPVTLQLWQGLTEDLSFTFVFMSPLDTVD